MSELHASGDGRIDANAYTAHLRNPNAPCPECGTVIERTEPLTVTPDDVQDGPITYIGVPTCVALHVEPCRCVISTKRWNLITYANPDGSFTSRFEPKQ